jgi:DNA-binding CsgD family transcriptional regulator
MGSYADYAAMGVVTMSPILTKSDMIYLRAYATNQSGIEMAEGLGLTLATVYNGLVRLRTKLGTHSRQETITKARELGLLPELNPSEGKELRETLRRTEDHVAHLEERVKTLERRVEWLMDAFTKFVAESDQVPPQPL